MLDRKGLSLAAWAGLLVAVGLWALPSAAARNVFALQVRACALGTDASSKELVERMELATGGGELALALRCPTILDNQASALLDRATIETQVDALFIGLAWEKRGNEVKALDVWRAAPQTARWFHLECGRSLVNGVCAEALEACGRATAIDPEYAPAYSRKGRVLMYCYHQPKDALVEFERAVALGEDSDEMWLAFAHALNEQGKLVQAAQLVEAHALHGALADAIRAGGARAEGRLEDAIQLYERAIAADPTDVWLYHGLALALFESDQREQARAVWTHALTMNPNFAPAREGLARLGGGD